ncbi:MFS transporter [Mammaliicoccus sciuri]|uniref:MFS transporter n=1 Tax=Mammaliicoccus sciuri TaxID=1296 RepID=UPI000A00FEC9|nr:MFS transporter [Mammaliicoccus sciuri]ORI05988.1 hypothetical protein B5723_05580 [Mammaliicoccus sciuri]
MNKNIFKILSITFWGNFFSSTLIFIIGLYILKEFENIILFGWSQAIGPIVTLALMPFLGPIIDKLSKKKILIIGQFISITALSLYFFTFSHHNLYLLLMIIVFLKITDNIVTTTISSTIILITEEGEVQRIKSLQQVLLALINIMAPLLGAIFFTVISLKSLVFIELICEMICLLFITSLHIKNRRITDNTGDERILSMFLDGLKYSFKHKKIMFSLFFAGIVNFILCSYLIGLPYIQVNVLDFKNIEFGLTESIFSLGLIASGIFLSISKSLKYPLKFSYLSVIGMSFLTILLGSLLMIEFNRFIYILLFCGFNFIIGIFISFASIPVTSWLTINIESAYQGRIFNLLNVLSQVLLPLGILFYSQIFNYFSYTTIFIISGIVLFLFSSLSTKIFAIDLNDNELS